MNGERPTGHGIDMMPAGGCDVPVIMGIDIEVVVGLPGGPLGWGFPAPGGGPFPFGGPATRAIGAACEDDCSSAWESDSGVSGVGCAATVAANTAAKSETEKRMMKCVCVCGGKLGEKKLSSSR